MHTVKALSALPGVPFPARTPRYVPRQGAVDYLWRTPSGRRLRDPHQGIARREIHC
jgi:hypothetical protein